jgi:hypothetical protein
MERVTEVMPAPGTKMTLAPEVDAKGFAVAARESRAIVDADRVFKSAEGIDLLGLQRKYHGSNSMPQFRKAEIFAAQLDALARYFAKR